MDDPMEVYVAWEQAVESSAEANKSQVSAARQEAGSRNANTPPVESKEDTRIQPWQSLMEEIERESNMSPPGSDYFPCQDGFYAHSLSG